MKIRKEKSSGKTFMVINGFYSPLGQDDTELLDVTAENGFVRFFQTQASDDDPDVYEAWYDVTGLTTLRNAIKNKVFTSDPKFYVQDIENHLNRIRAVTGIDRDRLYLTPDTIFIDKDGDIYLTYYRAKDPDRLYDETINELIQTVIDNYPVKFS